MIAINLLSSDNMRDKKDPPESGDQTMQLQVYLQLLAAKFGIQKSFFDHKDDRLLS